jgi:hypothetical protein
MVAPNGASDLSRVVTSLPPAPHIRCRVQYSLANNFSDLSLDLGGESHRNALRSLLIRVSRIAAVDIAACHKYFSNSWPKRVRQ